MQLFITLTLLTHALASSASTLQYRTNVVQRVISFEELKPDPLTAFTRVNTSQGLTFQSVAVANLANAVLGVAPSSGANVGAIGIRAQLLDAATGLSDIKTANFSVAGAGGFQSLDLVELYVGAVVGLANSLVAVRVPVTVRFTAKDAYGSVRGTKDFEYKTGVFPFLQKLQKVSFENDVGFRGAYTIEIELVGEDLEDLVVGLVAFLGIDDIKVNLYR